LLQRTDAHGILLVGLTATSSAIFASMRTILLRVLVPLALFAAGVASTIFGMTRHVIPVVQETEEEVSITIPPPFGPGPAGPRGPSGLEGPPMPGAPPFGDGPPGGPPMVMPPPVWQPPPMRVKGKKTTILTFDESEPKIIREVSVGGVTLADSGEIKRTYSGDEGPALCPT
jgi:hypothetical protein